MRHLFQSLSSVLLASSFLCGCGPDVAAKRQEWERKAPDTYVVGVCGTGFNVPGCQLYAVENDRVVASEVQFASEQTWSPVASAAEPIGALFDAAEHPGDCDLSIEFDAVFSYPTEIYFDCGEEGDGERVACFAPNSLDLDACRDSTVWKP